MTRGRDRRATRRRWGALVAAAGLVGAAGCASGPRPASQSAVAALERQLEEVRRSQDATMKELARLSAEVKALDAQSAFLVGAARGAREDLARMQAALDESHRAMRELASSVSDLGSPAPVPAAAPPPPPPAPAPPPKADASPETLYAAALASFQGEEHGQAVLEFTELTRRFPAHPLAANAQYWIGEAYYRQRDFRQALVEFQKVVDAHPKSAQVPEALLKIGLSHRALKEPQRARQAWEQVARDFPGTSASTQARSLLAAPGTGR